MQINRCKVKKGKGTDGRRKIYEPLESTRVEKDASNSNQAYEGGLIVKKRKSSGLKSQRRRFSRVVEIRKVADFGHSGRQ